MMGGESRAGIPEVDSSSGPVVIQWVLDTRKLWPEAKATRDLETVAQPYFDLLSKPEQEAVLRYVFVRDAKHTLGSALLKRHVISRYAGVPWSEATAVRADAKGKPRFVLDDGSEPVFFNVSHQDGLVVLVAVAGYSVGDSGGGGGKVEIGVDVVSCLERRDRDRQAVITEGWDAFVDVYESVFSPADVAALQRLDYSSTHGPTHLDAKLRCFYAQWCVKEAYVKMTGEALLADWIQKLEFRNLRPPPPLTPPTANMTSPSIEFGDMVGNCFGTEPFEVFRQEGRDTDVRMELQSLGAGYMLGTALRTPARPDDAKRLDLGSFRMISLEEITTPDNGLS